MTTRTSRATSGAITGFAQFVVLLILQVLLTPIILRVAGQDVLGAYAIIMQVLGYGLLLDLGLSVAIGRYLAQSFNADDEGKRFATVFNIGRYFVLATNSVISIFILVVGYNIEFLVSDSPEIAADAKAGLYLLAAWTIFRTPLILYGHGLLASQNMSRSNLIGLTGSTIRFGLSLYLVFNGYGLLGMVSAHIASEFAVLLVQKIHFNRLYPALNLRWCWPDQSLLKELFAFGVTYWGVNVAIVLTTGSDSIIIGHLYGASAVSIFYTTKIPTFLLIQLIYKIADNAGPAANELLAQGNIHSVRSAYLKILRYSLLLAVPLAIGVIGFNEGIIKTWVGSGQYAGHIMSFALASFVLTQVVSHLNAMITLATGNMQKWLGLSVITGLVTFFLAYYLGSELGIQWVMVAIALLDFPGFVFLLRRSFSGLGLTYTIVLREAVLPVVWAVLPLLMLVSFVVLTDTAKGLANLVTSICIFALLWVAGVFALGITKHERRLLSHKLGLSEIYD